MQIHRQGESVTFSGYIGYNRPGPQPVIIRDANAQFRPIQPQERLIIDAVSTASDYPAWLTTGSDYTLSTAGVVTVFVGIAGSPSQIPGTASQTFPGEGFPLPLGVTPLVTAPASTSATCFLTGVGRIVQDGPITNQRPSWKESLTGAGIPPGMGPTASPNNGGVIPGQQPSVGLQASAPTGLGDGSQNKVSPNAPVSVFNSVFVDPTPGSLLPPDNGAGTPSNSSKTLAQWLLSWFGV